MGWRMKQGNNVAAIRALGFFAVGQFAIGTVRRTKRKKKPNLTNLT